MHLTGVEPVEKSALPSSEKRCCVPAVNSAAAGGRTQRALRSLAPACSSLREHAPRQQAAAAVVCTAQMCFVPPITCSKYSIKVVRHRSSARRSQRRRILFAQSLFGFRRSEASLLRQQEWAPATPRPAPDILFWYQVALEVSGASLLRVFR